MLLSLTACGSAGQSPAADTGAGGNASRFNDSSAPAAAPEAEYTSMEVGESDMAGSMGSGSSIRDGRKITFSAAISLNTKQFDADYTKVYNLIEKTGGYISSENTYDNSASYGKPVGRYTNISARIPAGDYDSFIDAIAAIGDVTNKNKWSEDLTSEYFDTEARVELLELRKERLMAYLVEAEDAESIVAFERELSDVLYDLDYYQGNIRRLDRLVDYASVDVSLTELITPETIGKDGEPLGERARDAFSISMTNVGIFLENFTVGLAAAVPVIVLLLIIALIIWAIVRITRPLRTKHRARREAREAKRLEKRQGHQAYPPPPPYWQPPGYTQPQGYQPPPPPPSQAPAPEPEPKEPSEDK